MIVKICGIRTYDEAQAALDAGADMLGYNFYPPSPRWISPAECESIHSRLLDRGYSYQAVGVFVNEKPAAILEILEACGLDLAQLSGIESREDLVQLSGKGYKAIRPRNTEEARIQAQQFAGLAPAPDFSPALLVDAFHPGEYGGTGRLGDWAAAATLAPGYPILLAGGLKPENIHRALAEVRPWGVDVASGVESAPGKKDPARMAAFIQAVKSFEKEAA